MEAGVDEKVGAVYVNEGRVGGEPRDNWINLNALHSSVLRY